MGVWMSLVVGVSVSSDGDCWANVDISFVWRVVILVSSDDLPKLHRALLMMSSNKIFMKRVFCWHWVSSNIISSTCKGRLSSDKRSAPAQFVLEQISECPPLTRNLPFTSDSFFKNKTQKTNTSWILKSTLCLLAS